jgi:cytochrome c551/c552
MGAEVASTVPGTIASGAVWEGALLLVTLLLLAWTGILAGTATLSVAIDGLGGPARRALARDTASAVRADLVALAWMVATAFVLLTLVRLRHPAFPASAAAWSGVLLPLVSGTALVGTHRSLLLDDRAPGWRIVAGLAGVCALVASMAVALLGSGSLLQPAGWATSEPAFRILPTWSGVGRFSEFTALAFAATGGIVAARSGRLAGEAEGRFARRLGGGLALAALLAWPVAAVFTQVMLPPLALSRATWLLAAVALPLGAGAAWLASGEVALSAVRRGAAVAGAALLLLALGMAGEQAARANVLVPEVLAGLTIPPPPRAAHPEIAPPAPTPGPAPEAGGKLARGKAVFDRVCHLCHRFDQRLVGPPLASVLPKYRADPKALEAFLRSPTKKDPAFPAMPKPAIDEAEVEAVAAWVLGEGAR